MTTVVSAVILRKIFVEEFVLSWVLGTQMRLRNIVLHQMRVIQDQERDLEFGRRSDDVG